MNALLCERSNLISWCITSIKFFFTKINFPRSIFLTQASINELWITFYKLHFSSVNFWFYIYCRNNTWFHKHLPFINCFSFSLFFFNRAIIAWTQFTIRSWSRFRIFFSSFHYLVNRCIWFHQLKFTVMSVSASLFFRWIFGNEVSYKFV